LRKLETTLSSTSSILNLALASDGYFHSRCGYKFDTRVAKAAKMIVEDYPERYLVIIEKIVILDWNIGFFKCYLFCEFRMKYFKDIEILYQKFYIISKYCPISNNNVYSVFTDMNNIELSSYSDSSKEVYNINNNNNRSNIANNSSISDSVNINININNSENYSIVTTNVVNNSIGVNRVGLSNFQNNEYINIYVTWYRLYIFLLGGRDADIIDINYKKEWDVLYKNQIISGDYSKTLFLMRSSALFYRNYDSG